MSDHQGAVSHSVAKSQSDDGTYHFRVTGRSGRRIGLDKVPVRVKVKLRSRNSGILNPMGYKAGLMEGRSKVVVERTGEDAVGVLRPDRGLEMVLQVGPP